MERFDILLLISQVFADHSQLSLERITLFLQEPLESQDVGISSSEIVLQLVLGGLKSLNRRVHRMDRLIHPGIIGIVLGKHSLDHAEFRLQLGDHGGQLFCLCDRFESPGIGVF